MPNPVQYAIRQGSKVISNIVPHLSAQAAPLVDTPAHQLWYGHHRTVSPVYGKEKIEQQLDTFYQSPLRRLSCVDRHTYQTVLSALLTSHYMLILSNDRAMDTVYSQIKNNPKLQTQANELRKLLDAEYGLIGVTKEHEYPHPNMLNDAYASLNQGKPVPPLHEPLVNFFKRSTLPVGQEMNYLGVLDGTERSARELVFTQEFIMEELARYSPYVNQPFMPGHVTYLPGPGVVRTFNHAHHPFEDDRQSQYLTPTQKAANARALAAPLTEIEEWLRGNGNHLQANLVAKRRANLLAPDQRGSIDEPHSTDPTKADTGHIKLVDSLKEHFVGEDPHFEQKMDGAFAHTVATFHTAVTPVLTTPLRMLRDAEQKLGLVSYYESQRPGFAKFWNQEGEKLAIAEKFRGKTLAPYSAVRTPVERTPASPIRG